MISNFKNFVKQLVEIHHRLERRCFLSVFYGKKSDFEKGSSGAKYKGQDILSSGNTEMFVDDVLMLDKEVA